MTGTHKRHRIWSSSLFFVLFSGQLGLGIYLSYIRDFVYYDAVSRVANAFYVLYSRDPHLGAIGFVWNPLPSLLELLPLLAYPIIPAIATAGLAANLLTALFAAGTSLMLFSFCRKSTGSLTISLILTLSYSLNPFIFLYGSNGMSEAMFSFFIVWMVISFINWLQTNKTSYTLYIGFSLAAAFWVRYESVALGIALLLGVVAVALDQYNRMKLGNQTAIERYTHTEASLIVMLTPAVFSGFTWLFLNWIIMGDPLYFFRSGYSNIAFSGNLTDQFLELTSTPVGALWLVLRKSLYFSLPLLGILLLRIINGNWRRWETAALIMLACSIPAMQYMMLLNNSSFGWLRFFVYPFIIAVAWLPYEFSLLKLESYYRWAVAGLCALVMLSSLVLFDMNNHELSPDEYEVFHIDESGTHYDLTIAKEVSHYTDQLFDAAKTENRRNELLILTDSYSAYSVLLNSRYPKQWVITNDRDFEQALEDPFAHNIAYVLVSKQIGAVQQIIHETYPNLFEQGDYWAELEKDFNGDWRLFRVISSVSGEGLDG